MAINEYAIRSAVNLKLQDGDKTRSVALGKVAANADAADVYGVAGNVASLLEFPVSAVQLVETTQLEVA